MTAGPTTVGAANGTGPAPVGPLSVLARFRQPAMASAPGERCEMCAEPISSLHTHVVDVHDRTMVCTCRACYLLFTGRGAGGGRYRAVPERFRTVLDFELTPSQWDSLQIPVTVAFFFDNSALGTTAAFFPSPAGATECLLPLDTWSEVVRANPVIETIEPDVEAALIRTDPDDQGWGAECFIVPIDSLLRIGGPAAGPVARLRRRA